MIYILLEENRKTEFKQIQNKIVEFVKQNIRYKYLYQFVFCKEHIIEETLEKIDYKKDIVIWNPIVAYNNLELVKNYHNSIVILEKPSVYVQKISKHNPINENTAINNGFYLLYLNVDDLDVTNNEYKIVIKESQYLLTLEEFNNLISGETITTEVEVEELLDTEYSIKKQINLQ